MQEKVKGVVLKTMDYKEKDKLMWIFTEQLGKLSVICKGVRSPKSRYQSLVRPLLFGEFLLYPGKTLYILNEGTPINSFKALTQSLEALTYSSYYVEMADIATSDQDPNPLLYRNLVTALYLLESGAVDMEVLTLAFEVKLIESTGFRVSTDLVPFPVSKAAENVLDFIRRTDMAKVHVLKVEKGLQKELSQLTSYIIRENYPRRPKSLDLLKYM